MASSEHDQPRPDPWRALLLAQNVALRAIEADLKAAGAIPLSWYDVLLELRAAPDMRLRMQEVAGRVVLSRTRVSRLVDELVSAGYVRKERDPDDGRAWFAVLTPEGRKARRTAAPIYLAAIDRHFTSHLSVRQRQTVEQAMRRVIEANGERD